MRPVCLLAIVAGLMMPAPAILGAAPRARQEAPAVAARVDERVELLSIVARLAGYEEYVNDDFRSYAGDVDRHFGAYRQHPAIELARALRAVRGVSHDAIMAMAVHLTPPPALSASVPFSDAVPDRRWGKRESEQFVGLLQRFYRDTDAAAFFTSHAGMYRAAEARFGQLLAGVDFGWYRRFYGELPAGGFHLCIGLLNGGSNYGPKVVRPDGREDLYAIIGSWQFDAEGRPAFDARQLPTIIHEYNHSFINPLVDANAARLKASAEAIYPQVGDEMRRLAYGTWQAMMYESLVRAAVIRYLIEHEPGDAKRLNAIHAERNLGFVWMEDLVELLGRYESRRDQYRVFGAFMPEVAAFYQDLAPQMAQRVGRFNAARPSVRASAPFSNGAQDVDPGITELTFTFDRPLEPKGVSINPGLGGQAQFPVVGIVGFGEDGATLTIRLKMEPATAYEFILTEKSFRTRDGFPLRPYTMKFKTR